MKRGFKIDAEAFRNDLSNRGVTRLIHFTTLINLISIFEQGKILSRTRLNSLGAQLPDLHLDDFLTINDKLRLDYAPDFINLSVETPNIRLLKKFRALKSRESDTWCILAIDPEPITWADTQFSITNAASNAAKLAGIGSTLSHWVALFRDKVDETRGGKVIRRNMPENSPSDSQAEVLVQSEISYTLIKEIFFENEEDMRTARGSLPLVSRGPFPALTVNPNIFT